MTELGREPTKFAALNRLLAIFVRSVRESLQENLAGVYLQGSFALGAADKDSDVDFIVLTNTEVDQSQEAALQRMHATLFKLKTSWANHLEGSYAPRHRFRTVDASRMPFLFLDNGASRLERDPHCNNAVARWIVRERGIALFGPPPTEMVAQVDEQHLKIDARRALRAHAEWALQPIDVGRMSQWKQTYLVLTLCRILCTIEAGLVTSKHGAAEWALQELDSRWQPLIQRAIADRPYPWVRVHQEANGELANETVAFAEYALKRSEWN